MSVKVIYLSGPLQVAEVNVGDKENGLSLQVGQGLEVSGVGLLGSGYHADASVFPWTKKKRIQAKRCVPHYFILATGLLACLDP